jgi:hypothetical protein
MGALERQQLRLALAALFTAAQIASTHASVSSEAALKLADELLAGVKL